MRRTLETLTIANAYDLAQQEVYSLHDSMRESAENMPEQLSLAHANAADKLETALGSMYDCRVPTEFSELKITWEEWQGKIHRPQRRDNIVNFLVAYLARVPRRHDTEKLRTALQETIDALNNVYFPGMSGRRAA